MRKTRGVVIGSNGYPFLLHYWYELFERFWQNEVDHVYFAISNPEHKSSWGYIKNYLERNPKITVIETGLNWPDSLNKVAREVEEDLLFFPHDDTLIFKSGVIDNCFNIVESSHRVVTPLTQIFNPVETIQSVMQEKYPNQLPFNVEETGETGYSFYCNMFFITRELFHRTSMDFGYFRLDVGQYSPLLGCAPKNQPFVADTNFKLCLELLSAGAKVHGIKKNEIAALYNLPDPIGCLTNMSYYQDGNFTSDTGWIHLQTMAFHIYGLYYDVGEQKKLSKVTGEDLPPKIHNYKKSDITLPFLWSKIMQIAWIKEFMSVGDYSGMQKYYDHADEELAYVIKYLGTNPIMIDIFQREFHKLIWGKEK